MIYFSVFKIPELRNCSQDQRIAIIHKIHMDTSNLKRTAGVAGLLLSLQLANSVYRAWGISLFLSAFVFIVLFATAVQIVLVNTRYRTLAKEFSSGSVR